MQRATTRPGQAYLGSIPWSHAPPATPTQLRLLRRWNTYTHSTLCLALPPPPYTQPHTHTHRRTHTHYHTQLTIQLARHQEPVLHVGATPLAEHVTTCTQHTSTHQNTCSWQCNGAAPSDTSFRKVRRQWGKQRLHARSFPPRCRETRCCQHGERAQLQSFDCGAAGNGGVTCSRDGWWEGGGSVRPISNHDRNKKGAYQLDNSARTRGKGGEPPT
jgi:hypothetical protein